MKWKSIIFAAICICTSLLSMPSLGKAAMDNAAKDGVMKIHYFSENEIIKLNGEWEFYWQELLTPDDFKQEKIPTAPVMVKVPHPWTEVKREGKELPLAGFGTYRLQIHLPEAERGTLKAVYIPTFASAYTLWINGEEKARGGIVGTTKEGMKPQITSTVIPFLADANPVELIIQVSNFHQRSAGLDDQLLFGEPGAILDHRERIIITRTIIVFSLVIIGLYHLVLFAFRRKEYSFLFFAITCMVVAIRGALLEEGLSSSLFSFLNWELARKLEYLGASLGTLCIALFTYTQFPDEMKRKGRNILSVALASFSLLMILTPAVVFTRAMVLLQALIIITFIYVLYVYLKAARQKREGSYLNAAATFVLFLAVLNDVLFYNDLIRTVELTSVGLFFFLFTQAVILSKRYSHSFAQAEQLSKDLGALNASLEEQVQDRTMELARTNEELAETNQRLHEAQQSRNKWIRNISHEIAGPLTNIRSYAKGMMDGIIPANQKYLQIIYEQSVFFSRMLHDLHDITEMENNQIKFNMENIDIRDFASNMYEKYKWELDRQGIEFVFHDMTLEGDVECFVLMDPVRIEQVIVNLLSNAQRFVGENGKIVMELSMADDGQITINVRDNGAGIEAGELDKVFERFYKSSRQGKPHNGAGLGLAIVKEIIDSHKGKLSVTSKPGKGSCFSFSLPMFSRKTINL